MMHGTEPHEVEDVRCGSCGAATPIVDASEPRCVYCGRAVSVPAEVKARARELERAIDAARREVLDVAWELEPVRPGFARFVGYFQTAYALVALLFWYRIVAEEQGTLTQGHASLVGLALLGPLLFWLVSSRHSVDAAVAHLGKLAFAKLAVEHGDHGGLQLRVRCPSCGGLIERAKLQGLTIECTHCRTSLLAPSELVDQSQRRFHQRAVALRKTLLQRLDGRGLFIGVAGTLYSFAPVWMIPGLRGLDENQATNLLVAIIFSSWGAWVYWWWVLAQGRGEFWISAVMHSPILLGPAILVALYMIDVASRS